MFNVMYYQFADKPDSLSFYLLVSFFGKRFRLDR